MSFEKYVAVESSAFDKQTFIFLNCRRTTNGVKSENPSKKTNEPCVSPGGNLVGRLGNT